MQIIVFTTMRHWGWDDILMVIATVLMVLNAAANPIARTYGFGKDVWRLPFNHTSTVMKIFYIGGIIYAIAVAMTKMAFFCFYIRLFPRSTLQKWAYPILVITFIQGTIFTFLFIFQCNPISYAWTSWDGESEGKCLNFDVGAVLHAIFNIVLDFIIFFLPMRQMWQLNLSQKKRLQVLLMFAVGFCVTVISILRLISLIQLDGSTNPPYDYIPLGYWSDLELNIGIACLCMPSARVIIRRYFPNCRLATTAHDSRSDEYVRASQIRNDISSSGVSKLPRSVTRSGVIKDSSSDQVELFSVNRPEGRVS
ncbi:hypothetical protein B0A52_10104 [Exophiala mesophila]|uniref:Rhodopsin domain-containing protein n=1 Tax=Exophiala mesophila TaxID=212818 RepID=A0A438MSL4_EXOME|nr:hypothetical protein B0A52_10104 [Exophiala mesophila]